MVRIAVFLLIAGAFVAAVVAQQGTDRPGSPLAGITASEFELFRMGREDFLEVETAGDGLGPTFNGTSCAQCHNIPAIGGTGTMIETRAGRLEEDGTFTAPAGGTLHHLFSTPPHNCQVNIYPDANVIAHRISMPLFGAGLVEAIPDSTLLALSDPDDRDGDGISGRAAVIRDIATGRDRVGRFGWKAQHATLLAFAADAYVNEMGITNDLFREEVSADGDPAHLRLCDPAADPEDVRDPRTGLRGIDNFANFLRFLAPPPRGPISIEVERGLEIFRTVGCAACHVPELRTGQSANPVFDRKPVPLFSDLLLHDIGTGDRITQGAAEPNEIRTPSLWGLRFRRPLLHDGSAATPEEAILRHLGEAMGVRKNYEELSTTDKSALLAFLRSL